MHTYVHIILLIFFLPVCFIAPVSPASRTGSGSVVFGTQ